jgi:tripartite-type tricarboxylate transporter receptor subunit TctC
MKTGAVVLTSLALLPLLAGAPHAEETFPNRTIVMTNIYAPGAGLDVIARAVAQKLTDKWKVPVLVESKPGAGGTIAAAYVARQPADGYSLLLTDISFSINPSIYKNISYDPITSFQPIVQMNSVTQALAVNANLPVKSLADVVAYAKANPSKLIYASAGAGSVTQLGMEILKKEAGVDITQVMYRGGIPAMTDLIAGRAQMYMGALATTLPQIKQGGLKVVAVMQKNRSPMMPEIESSSEAGYPSLDFSAYYGILAPAGTPRAAVQKMATAVNEALQTPELQRLLSDLGCEFIGAGPDEFSEFLKKDIARWQKAVEISGTTPYN